MTISGQNYSTMWKQVRDAERNDLPKTQYEVLQQIVKKASKERAYGHLLKAELTGAKVLSSISPDSLKPAVQRIEKRSRGAMDDVLRVVYQTVLYRVCRDNTSLEMKAEKPQLTEALCRQLAQVSDKSYEPFVVEGSDSYVFGHDLLSIIGYELQDYPTLYNYYRKTGNRKGACLTAEKALLANEKGRALQAEEYLHQLDLLISEYGDLLEAGELAISRYRYMSERTNPKIADQIGYIRMALGKWGEWKRMNALRNEERRLTNPQFSVEYEHRVTIPNRPLDIVLKDMRGISDMTISLYRLNAKGDISLDPNNSKDYKQLKPLLSERLRRLGRKYVGKRDYELYDDTIRLEGLPVGVYMLEFSSDPATETVRRLYFVTDVYTMAEAQPDGTTRYVVVSATTGQPLPGAHLRIREYASYDKFTTSHVVADSKGEYIYKGKNNRREVFAYTADDTAAPEVNLYNRYQYYAARQEVRQTCLFTDRSIYRPGQTVRAAAIVYDVNDGYKHHAASGQEVTFTLRDANYKEVKTVKAVTDKYGSCEATFTLPQKGLTGYFTLQAGDQNCRLRVEEYKRPTFEVVFPEVKQAYDAGDTVVVRATARSYAGAPVQGAKVKYKVVRRMAFWWWNYSRYWGADLPAGHLGEETLSTGEAVTDALGTFAVELPMVMPEGTAPLFYHFVATADVTDLAGETHSGQISLPLGNRKTALSVDIAEKVLAEDKPTATFHLYNAAGMDTEAEVDYQIDGGKWQKAATQSAIAIGRLKSGGHTLKAICEGDTIERHFVVFSLDDQRPAEKTDEWFYVSHSQFPDNGQPVTVQVGSSDEDVHIVYSIFTGERLMESGSVERSNQLVNRKFSYQPDWGNGIVLSFAWVKEGKCHKHTFAIQRPLPDKQLKLTWKTFRDRLTPGQQEEWVLDIRRPDGKPANAVFMATLYDKSLDQLQAHQWYLHPYIWLPLPSVSWTNAERYGVAFQSARNWRHLTIPNLVFSHFDEEAFPSPYAHFMTKSYGRRLSRGNVLMAKDELAMERPMAAGMAMEADGTAVAEQKVRLSDVVAVNDVAGHDEESEEAEPQVSLRENMQETAFFYPQLKTDEEGRVVIRFTLPESLTTWRLMGLAHTEDLCYGMTNGEVVAQKDVMVQPNLPRFIREGDMATVATRVMNLSERQIAGKARLRLLDAQTERIVFESEKPFALGPGATTAVAFDIESGRVKGRDLLICQVSADGDGFSDGEQHYLPVLPATSLVMLTRPFTLHGQADTTIDLASLLPHDAVNPKMTLEYTNHPSWLMIQALPTVGHAADDNAVSQAAAYYANSLGQHIIAQYPQVKTAVGLWQQESADAGNGSLASQLSKNEELRELLLSETPWVLDADRETEQRQRLADFFDENQMRYRLDTSLEKLADLQLADGSWTWWKGMPSSFYITVTVSEMLVRLNALTGARHASSMLDRAFDFMGKEIVREVGKMKSNRNQVFPGIKALQWLYLATLDGRRLPASVEGANRYLMELLKKDIKNQTLYEKALTAVILSHKDVRRAKDYVKSLNEYTVYREETGRYFDTPRAAYSWCDYRIPTQTAVIEALQRIMPDDRKTIEEMQRWLLQSKRTQAWDTPVNSVNAVYAFLNGGKALPALDAPLAVLKIDGQPLDATKATAALGYVKTQLPAKSKKLSVSKAADDTSWGAVYSQFTQPVGSIKDSGSGLKVRREVQSATLQVGSRVKVRIIIEADRDYDFVQVIDRRAACLEPVGQLSGYHNGAYCTPKDYSTNYYFNRLSKGRHVLETEYYVDRPGTYESGTCVVECAYAPEFRAVGASVTFEIKN